MKFKRGIATTVIALIVTGCGGSDDESTPAPTSESSTPTASTETTAEAGSDYCAVLEQTRDELSSLDPTSLDDSKFDDLRDKLEDLETTATGAISGDWKALGDSLDRVKSALDAANLQFSDIPQLASGQVPNGADASKLPEVKKQVQKLASDPALAEAAERITTDAKAECDIDLGAAPAETTPTDATPS